MQRAVFVLSVLAISSCSGVLGRPSPDGAAPSDARLADATRRPDGARRDSQPQPDAALSDARPADAKSRLDKTARDSHPSPDAAPSCTDKVKNGNETDVDCGGSCPTRCATGKKCAAGSDCQSGVCPASSHVCTCPGPGGTLCGSADSYTVTHYLGDPGFANGIQQGNDLGVKHAACKYAWRAKISTLQIPPGDTPWALNEVGERMLFCDESTNPSLVNGAIVYTNPTVRGAAAGAKRIVDHKDTAKGVQLFFDSGQEWRGGCDFTKDDELNGNAHPLYKAENGAWGWHHLLLVQGVKDPCGSKQRLRVDKHNKLTFGITLKVAKSTRVDSSPYYTRADSTGVKHCPATDYGGTASSPASANHALFYAVLVLDDANYDPIAPARRLYVVLPVWHTHDGKSYRQFGPALLPDPIQAKVYVTGLVRGGSKYEPLSLGQDRIYSFDVQELAAEAIGAFNQRQAELGETERWKTADYFVAHIDVGWEIWGGYVTEATIRNPSLTGFTYSEHLCPVLHRYWNGTAGDHYYTTDYLPAGFPGYAYEGPSARIPVVNMSSTVKLWRYWNATLGDHYYSTDLKPLSLKPLGYNTAWILERQAGSIFPVSPGAGYEAYEQWWCADNADHLYQLASGADPASCYAGRATIGYLKKP